MRLIDADELRVKAYTAVMLEPDENNIDYVREKRKVVDLDDIDNAPTVDITEEQAIDKLHETGWLPMHDKEMTERPTGEWKITEAYPHKVYCDKCYKTYAQENWEVWKDGSLPRDFCPSCGAKMKGENE